MSVDPPESSVPVFEAVTRSPRLSDHVADMILETIVGRSMTPGQRLPSERELGSQFGVSRTVIREAVRALTAKGVLDVRSGSGLRVAAVDASSVAESMSLFIRGIRLDYGKVHEVRALIEIEIAGLAAERGSPADIARLGENLEAMRSVLDDADAAATFDVEFHRGVAAATQNELYPVLLDSMGEVLLGVRRSTLTNPGRPVQALEAHRRIFLAIAAGEPAKAREAMRSHLEDSAGYWISQERSDGGERADRRDTSSA